MCLDHHEEYLVTYRSAEFGWNRCSSVNNMQVFIFCELGVKMRIHDSEMFWGFDRQNRHDPKSTSLRGNTSYDVLIVQIGSNGVGWAGSDPKY